jgi:hypothetical protein
MSVASRGLFCALFLFFIQTSMQVVCKLGSYKTALWGYDECSDCLYGKYSDTNESSGCTACATGKFSGWGASSCTNCPDNSIGPIGSTTVEACECLPGYGFAPQNACEACEIGTYKYKLKNTVCTPCPVNSTSLVGSTAVSSCLCDSSFAFRTPNRTVTFTDFRSQDGRSVFCDASFFTGEYKLYGTHDNRPVYKRSTSNHYLWSVAGANWMITSETLLLQWGQKSDIPEVQPFNQWYDHYIFSNMFMYLAHSKGFEDVTEFADFSYNDWFQWCPTNPGNGYFRHTSKIMSVVDACTNLTTPAPPPAAPAPSPTPPAAPSPTPPAAPSPTPPAAPSPTPSPTPPAAPVAYVPASSSANEYVYSPAPRTGWAPGIFPAIALLWWFLI